jgi:benzoate 4-monooxygenase
MAEDIEICGEVFKAGTILSVPSYTLHHLDSVWSDPFVYRPERWLEEGGKDLEKSLNIFSYGPRSCVGRNVAMAELLVFISTIIYRYDIKLKDEIREELEVTEGFLRKVSYFLLFKLSPWLILGFASHLGALWVSSVERSSRLSASCEKKD